ncbi:MAG: RNA polymerase sigma factor [Anaerolineales bacterium]|nr:RNA polymerase sigma factor [Anaerolineales bacterium]
MNNNAPKPDAESLLISQALDGSTQAVDVLYNRYLNLVYNYVYYRIGQKRDTEELTEKIFIKAFEHLRKYPKREYFLAWILKFASQEVRRFQTTAIEKKIEAPDLYLSDEQEKLMRVLKSLNEKSYQFVVARFFNGLSEQATGKILGITLEQFDDTQFQAIKALEKLLKKDGQNG